MRTLLVLTKQSSLATAVQTVLDPVRFQTIIKEEVTDAEILLSRGAIDAVIIDVDPPDERSFRLVRLTKEFAPGCPVIVFATAPRAEWEEDAYLLGVEHVLAKPVRGKLLNELLGRIFPPHEHKASVAAVPMPHPENGASRLHDNHLRALEALRRFSGILTHSLDSTAMLKQFLLLLREIIGVNRAIIFLRKPASLLGDSPLSREDRWLRSACAIGIDQNVLSHFALSLGAGIGGYLHHQGRILRACSTEAQSSRDIAKEFQLLGAQVAIPILDRESLLGVAVFDERLTGEPFANEELALIFHMLEEVGLAIRNSWLHDQLESNHTMIADILGHLGSGCIVISSNLSTLHANAAATKIFLQDRPGKSQFEFTDLPQQLGSKVFTVLKTGMAEKPFKYSLPGSPDRIYNVEIVPFRPPAAPETNSALLLIEDISEHERAQKLEGEASKLRLVKAMAEHLAHEIGNAVVPISTHQQLLSESIHDQEFQESLSNALANGVKRITRLANQMVFLARESSVEEGQTVQVADLIVEAFQEAHTFHPGKKIAQLSFNKQSAPWRIQGDPKALRHAFSEIMLNALQANPENPTVSVKLEENKKTESPILQVEVRDSGRGFSEEAAERAAEPFYSTRNVGLGIGLTVTRRIIENHHGTIEIPPTMQGETGVVRIQLPISN